MASPPTTHPARDDLMAYGLGKLDSAAADTIGSHLETCVECRRAVAEEYGDEFLNRLREARRPSPTPDGSVSGLARGMNRITPAKAVPPELTDSQEYTDIVELGRGGMGVVYKARNRLMDRDEVLKVMDRTVMAMPGARDRFIQEIRAASRLGHPNIVRAHSARLFGELLVFSMEFVPGDELGKLVKARGPLPVATACVYAVQVANGLQHAHEAGMVHRDIKPANLIRQVDTAKKRHTVKILDFGLAKVTSEAGYDAGLTGAGRMMGTPGYVAPEQITDAAAADIRADIYSLGCTLCYLLTGGPPFRADSLYELLRKHREEDRPQMNLVRPDVPAELAAVIGKMMAKDPAQRFQTPVEVARALAPFAKPGTSLAKPQLSQVAGPAPAAIPAAGQPSVPASPAIAAPVAPPPIVAGNNWETLASVSTAGPAPTSRSRGIPVWAWPVGVLGLLGVVLAGLLVGAMIKVKSKHGTVVLENLPPDAEVVVDGKTVTVTRNREAATISLTESGPHRVTVVQGGQVINSSEVTVTIGGEPVHVQVEQPVTAGGNSGKSPPFDQKSGQEGFVPLFNGKDLSGFFVDSGEEGAWAVVDGTLAASAPEENPRSLLKQGYLLTVREYSDFVLRLQFQQHSSEYAWGGVALRAVPHEPVRSTNPAIPVADDFPFHLTVVVGKRDPAVWSNFPTGSFWWSSQPGSPCLMTDRPPTLRPVGDWNDMEIEFRDQVLRVVVNGTEVQNVGLNRVQRPINPARGLNRFSGSIGFLKRAGEVRYRNVQIKELVPSTLPTDAATRVKPYVISTWTHTPQGGGTATIKLYSNGRINSPDSANLWVLYNDHLVLRWSDPAAPGGMWVDDCAISADGRRYNGRNLQGRPVSGVKIDDGEGPP